MIRRRHEPWPRDPNQPASEKPGAVHARGSTPAWLPVQGRDEGSPARAGIDPFASLSAVEGAGLPRCGPTRPSTRWLPRTRGDRPVGVMTTGVDLEAPPHARGSTRSSAVCIV